MMGKSSSPSPLRAVRGESVLVTPAKPTPQETKQLSDIDDQEGLRFLTPMIFLYKNQERDLLRNEDHKDPAKVIQDALAKALVYYYPFAGRLREDPDRKLTVDCTGEGVVFVEADSETTLEELGDALGPPFSCLDELLYDDHVSGVVGSPLLFVQVTRFKCGGFTLSCRLNHTLSDGAGIFQFLYTVAEIARGSATKPSMQPVWQRYLLRARAPPSITHLHQEYDGHDQHPHIVDDTSSFTDASVLRSFFFSNRRISLLRSLVPPHLQARCSDFELLTAFLWKCRTIALNPQLDKAVHMLFTINVRHKLDPPLPAGYYGNAFAFCGAMATAGDLCTNPLGYALELVKRAKAQVTNEYVRSLVDYLAVKGRPHYITKNTFLATDHTRIPVHMLDFGWGRPVYGGVAADGVGDVRAAVYSRFRDWEGKNGTSVLLRLPELAMERLALQFRTTFKDKHHDMSEVMIPHSYAVGTRALVSSM